MRERDRRILRHIVDYCDRLGRYTGDIDYHFFQGSDMLQDACSLCILQIGELVYNLTDEFKETYSGVPWRQIRAMRNIVAHHYGVIDAETVWDTLEDDIPELRKYCQNVLDQIKKTDMSEEEKEE